MTRSPARPDSPVEVVDAYHRAWTGGDVDAALRHLADDVVLHAPDPGVRTREDWHGYLSGFVPMLTAAPELTRMIDGDRVALWYFPQTATATTVLAAELFTVTDGRITEIRLSFDRQGYLPAGARS